MRISDWSSDVALPICAQELELVKLLAQFPRTVEAAASAREPHRIAFYLADVAAAFHAWYNLGNDDPSARIVLDNDPELTARSEERRVGKEWVRTCKSRWSTYH